MRTNGAYRNCRSRLTARWSPLLILAGLAVCVTSAFAQSQPQTAQIVTFADFLTSLKSTRSAAFVGRSDAKVRNVAEFAKMRAHLLRMYGGASATHSFLLDNQTFDCIPTLQQPSIRLLGLTGIATPPPPGGAAAEAAPKETTRAFDTLGNLQQCADGTIPMRRITLQELSRYETLARFFGKFPPTMALSADSSATSSHRWAHAYEYAINWGGEALHSVWRPTVQTAASEVFSLSQQWYAGKLGNGPSQTAEIGWQNYPAKWGGQKAVVFIYWTADNYGKTGCYNLECPGFVQTSNKHPLGSALAPGAVGGTQREEYFAYYLHDGNWWAAVGPSKSQSYWLGYYPTSIYKKGQMFYYATEFDIGGETLGVDKWPAMGSGHWASKGFQYAAYDRGIQYRDSNNRLYTPRLTSVLGGANASNCYAITPSSYSASNLTSFYFGGPGGKGC